GADRILRQHARDANRSIGGSAFHRHRGASEGNRARRLRAAGSALRAARRSRCAGSRSVAQSPLPADVELAQQAGDLRVSMLAPRAGSALFDLQVYVAESTEGIATVWEYATDLFEAAT